MRILPIVTLTLALAFASAARENTLLDSGWRFQSGDTTNAQDAIFDDSSWSAVSVPHNWGWEEAQQGKNFYRGPAWYRRDLNIGAPLSDRRYYLKFEAASTVVDVYLNGRLLGQHRGGFGAFCYEITRDLSTNGTNVLAVRVSNRPEPDIAPLSGDFSVYGGLYRPVHLIETSDENITPSDHGSPGVAWLQTSVNQDQAVLDVTAEVSNGSRRNSPLTLVASVFDVNGDLTATTRQEIRPTTNRTAPYFLQVSVNNPHLWNGLKTPYLYKAVVELRSTNDVIDSVEQPLGLRFYTIDPDKGFFLNGQPGLYGRSTII